MQSTIGRFRTKCIRPWFACHDAENFNFRENMIVNTYIINLAYKGRCTSCSKSYNKISSNTAIGTANRYGCASS